MRKKTVLRKMRIVLVLVISLSSVQCRTTGTQPGSVDSILLQEVPGEGAAGTVQTNLSMAEELKFLPDFEYILGPEDELRISVFPYAEMERVVTVSSTGKISYYLIGDIQAAGLTQFELRDDIEKELRKFIKVPKVIVEISAYRSHKIFVLGQLANPGIYRKRGDFTLIEAVTAAGGITAHGYLGGAYVVRDGKILLVNFVELIEKGNMSENIPLMADDVVYVPSTQDRKVYVLGEVHRQSAIPVGDKLTLLSAIAETGGFTNDAQKDSILVLRGNLSNPLVLSCDASRLDGFKDIPLQPGDVVYVAPSGFAKVERLAMRISNVLDPLLKVTNAALVGKVAKEVFRGEQEYNINLGNKD